MPVRPITRLSRSDLADLNAFRTVERLRSFTQAAVELGITTSALSHAVRNLGKPSRHPAVKPHQPHGVADGGGRSLLNG